MKSLIIGKFAGPMIRHAATVFGGYLLAQGIADEATVEQIVGGVVAAGGVALSFYEKKLRF